MFRSIGIPVLIHEAGFMSLGSSQNINSDSAQAPPILTKYSGKNEVSWLQTLGTTQSGS